MSRRHKIIKNQPTESQFYPKYITSFLWLNHSMGLNFLMVVVIGIDLNPNCETCFSSAVS